jgi:hypothetical protein
VTGRTSYCLNYVTWCIVYLDLWLVLLTTYSIYTWGVENLQYNYHQENWLHLEMSSDLLQLFRFCFNVQAKMPNLLNIPHFMRLFSQIPSYCLNFEQLQCWRKMMWYMITRNILNSKFIFNMSEKLIISLVNEKFEWFLLGRDNGHSIFTPGSY